MLAAPSIVKAQSRNIRIGYVRPATGPMALFGETDGFAVDRIKTLLADGLEVNGEN